MAITQATQVTPAAIEEPVQTPAPALPPVLPEPKAGGNYLRCPLTGALSLNPDHPTQPE